jgi:hypothetical protein
MSTAVTSTVALMVSPITRLLSGGSGVEDVSADQGAEAG